MDFAFQDDFIKFTHFHVYINCKSRAEAASSCVAHDEAHRANQGGDTEKNVRNVKKNKKKRRRSDFDMVDI